MSKSRSLSIWQYASAKQFIRSRPSHCTEFGATNFRQTWILILRSNKFDTDGSWSGKRIPKRSPICNGYAQFILVSYSFPAPWRSSQGGLGRKHTGRSACVCPCHCHRRTIFLNEKAGAPLDFAKELQTTSREWTVSLRPLFS